MPQAQLKNERRWSGRIVEMMRRFGGVGARLMGTVFFMCAVWLYGEYRFDEGWQARTDAQIRIPPPTKCVLRSDDGRKCLAWRKRNA